MIYKGMISATEFCDIPSKCKYGSASLANLAFEAPKMVEIIAGKEAADKMRIAIKKEKLLDFMFGNGKMDDMGTYYRETERLRNDPSYLKDVPQYETLSIAMGLTKKEAADMKEVWLQTNEEFKDEEGYLVNSETDESRHQSACDLISARKQIVKDFSRQHENLKKQDAPAR